MFWAKVGVARKLPTINVDNGISARKAQSPKEPWELKAIAVAAARSKFSWMPHAVELAWLSFW